MASYHRVPCPPSYAAATGSHDVTPPTLPEIGITHIRMNDTRGHPSALAGGKVPLRASQGPRTGL